ncbi:MAG: acetyl-CoA carboxylase biotin carboxylase subunit [Bacteroidetes Order II. Incertae sedis bacterium]|nr:acetyl-CoA carboxylase biotin carboxylase subunit [Bacteroidetes Order II. bacterium]
MSVDKSIHKILIANRGEIAVRVIRSCKELGIRTVAVFSDADRTAMHVRLADEAFHVGAAPSSESYLIADRILKVALKAGADAVHPGYGFLSENAEFARACEREGIAFIGPPADAIESMGDKTAARALMEHAGVPMAPGTVDAIASTEEAFQIAGEIGYPVLIKAAAGGGGKGMRVVSSPDEFISSMESASREAESAFGDGRVFIEKYIDQPRHIEFQILADQQGKTVHLFERECSIQRRHQKVIEEAPSSILTPELREMMGQAAIEAARSCGYVGAGTVEFLVDKDLNFYFMEMNTRLQVEHPVTEMITGIDLVAAQIRIAEGHPLPFVQSDLSIHGHAVESRVYAEDPSNNFLPAPGTLVQHIPPSGHGVRLDSGVDEGSEIPVYYDPMISKLSTWGSDRSEAISRMARALDEYQIAGVETTIPFCHFVMEHPAFQSGDFSTHFVADHFSPEVLAHEDPEMDQAIAIAAALYVDSHHAPEQPVAAPIGFSAWKKNRSELD